MGLLNDSVSDIIERRNLSRNYMRDTYYDEWTEVFRALCCRTSPIYERDQYGKETTVEDKTKTNVAMPDLSLIHRRNTARMTAQPYRLNYRGGDDMIAQMLSALAAQQYDRSDEATHDRRVVMVSEALGIGIGKLYWDEVKRLMVFRKALVKGGQIVYRDRASIMRAQGAGEDEIKQAVEQQGKEMSDEEVAQFMGKTGTEAEIPQEIRKYDGPAVKGVFPGDFHFEPGVLSIDDSDWHIEEYTETDLWLRKMARMTYRDEDGKDVPAFDEAACAELLERDPGPDEQDQKINDLRQMFRSALGQVTPRVEKRLLSRKRFGIMEYHALGEDGRMWVQWASDKMTDRPLGKMPYPWDLFGQTVYTEHVPLPSMISAVGDSTPRQLRFLYLLHNRVAAQNFDYITDLLQFLILRETGTQINQDVITRGRFRELAVSNLKGMEIMKWPPLPTGAFEREAEILRMMAAAEPSLNTVDTGTASNPMAGKLATTAMLNAKASDALTQFKIDCRNTYLRKLGQKKLWMNQRAAQEAWMIDSRFAGQELTAAMEDGSLEQWAQNRGGAEQWGLSSRLGKTTAIRLDPLEIQEDYEVEPEAGSFLAVDDELRQDAAMRMQAVAAGSPGIVDQRKLARFQLSTIRGIGNPDEYILPEQPAPGPEIRTNISVAVKFSELPAGVRAHLLGQAGIEVDPADVEAMQTLENVKHISDAADASANLMAPANPPEPTPGGKPPKKAA